MNRQQLSYKELNELLDRAVREKGETHKAGSQEEGGQQCRYFDEDTKQPSCIVGHVFAYKGIGFDDLESFSDRVCPNQDTITTLQERLFYNLGRKTQDLLFEVQELQDSGYEWGEAVAMARHRAEAGGWA
jgi:hypothetical protein